jgi:hypothetical protein
MNRLFEKFPWLNNVRNLTFIFAGIVVIATIHRLWLGEHSFNNFSIFRFSFFNLLHGNDLYILHPDQYNDLYKYSPTFAFLMAPFYAMPRWMGLFVFNLLNALVPFWAVSRLNISPKAKSFILLFVMIELLSSIQNAQSNGIMAGLMIAAFSCFERKEIVLAALFICLGFYLKIFGAAVGILFLFYDKKLKFIISCVVIGIFLGVLPMVVTGIDGLIFQYKSWLHLLGNDPSHELNFSIMTLTQRWFNFTAPDSWYLIPGMILLLLPLVRVKEWKNFSFRLFYLAAILVWVVIFNHKAESPTYVIAVFGVALWGIMEGNKNLRIFMLVFVYLFTILSPTDAFPPYVRLHVWQPYCLKALPCIIMWGIMTWQLLMRKDWKTLEAES